MTNFIPFTRAALRVMDGLIETHRPQGPFLDAGCGTECAALHLTKRGWSGVAVDSSPKAVDAAERALQGYPFRVECADMMNFSGSFRTIVCCTVIEHILDDVALLRVFRRSLEPDGWLILSMPTNPETEWRWDDDYYGHYRRYTMEDVRRRLDEAGFELVELCDYTFPFFWALRRVYTWALPVKKTSSIGSGREYRRKQFAKPLGYRRDIENHRASPRLDADLCRTKTFPSRLARV